MYESIVNIRVSEGCMYGKVTLVVLRWSGFMTQGKYYCWVLGEHMEHTKTMLAATWQCARAAGPAVGKVEQWRSHVICDKISTQFTSCDSQPNCEGRCATVMLPKLYTSCSCHSHTHVHTDMQTRTFIASLLAKCRRVTKAFTSIILAQTSTIT